MRLENVEHTLQPTALVHEAYLRLTADRRPWQDERALVAAAAEAMRRVLVDHARSKKRIKRGAGWQRSDNEADLETAAGSATGFDYETLDEGLREFESHYPRKTRIVQLRFFAGLTIEATARQLNLSPATVKRDWEFARAWLYRWLEERP